MNLNIMYYDACRGLGNSTLSQRLTSDSYRGHLEYRVLLKISVLAPYVNSVKRPAVLLTRAPLDDSQHLPTHIPRSDFDNDNDGLELGFRLHFLLVPT